MNSNEYKEFSHIPNKETDEKKSWLKIVFQKKNCCPFFIIINELNGFSVWQFATTRKQLFAIYHVYFLNEQTSEKKEITSRINVNRMPQQNEQKKKTAKVFMEWTMESDW